jgi:hypothetical protein
LRIGHDTFGRSLFALPRRRPTEAQQQESELMQKENKTAQELADMISAEINLGGTFIKVHPDKVHGSCRGRSPKRSRLAEGGRNNRHSVAR